MTHTMDTVKEADLLPFSSRRKLVHEYSISPTTTSDLTTGLFFMIISGHEEAVKTDRIFFRASGSALYYVHKQDIEQ